jgi:poly-beta-1,6-N-acetyl-D-glucosamine biosynthesis protein PgaD
MTRRQRPPPPLIETAAFSRLVHLRDLLLTLTAWALSALLVRNAVVLIWDFLDVPLFHLTETNASAWHLVLGIVLAYRLEFQILALWVLGWGLLFSLHRRHLSGRAPSTPPLLRAELAAAVGVPEATLLALEGATFIEADIGEGGRIATVRAAPEAGA